MPISRRHLLRLAMAAPAAASGLARSETYPARPIHVSVGLAAGGPTDVAARLLCDWLSQHLGQQVVVENRTGMAGNFATEAMVKAVPDGYTIEFTGPNVTISASLYHKLPFDFVRDTAPIATFMGVPDIMVVPVSLPVKTVQEFIDYAKTNHLRMASSGVGASPHLAGELFKSMTAIDMLHVPYRGSSAAYPDLISGRVDVLFDNLGGPVLSLIGAGKLRALGVTSLARAPLLPDVPAIADTVPGYEVNVWYGLFAPRQTAPGIIATLNKAVNDCLKDPRMLARISEAGGAPLPMTSAELGAFVSADIEKWRKVIETAKISVD